MPKQRIFIAFPVAVAAKKELEKAQTFLARKNKKARIRWVNPKLFHLTVAFVGEIAPNQVEAIKRILAKLAEQYHPFSYWLNRADAFPNKAHPSVVVVTAKEERRVGESLVRALQTYLREAGILLDHHPWKPHITIGRNKSDVPIQGLRTIVIDPIVWRVDHMTLIESTLTQGNPKYTLLDTFPLI